MRFWAFQLNYCLDNEYSAGLQQQCGEWYASCIVFKFALSYSFLFNQAERELAEMSYQMDGLNERLDEADGLTSAQVDLNFILVIIDFTPHCWR